MNVPAFTSLYNSDEIRSSLKDIFSGSSAGDRRIIIVAYIGEDWSAFLPDARGMIVVCSPTPGATSAVAITELQHAGAEVFFSDRLHMKVYWSQERGCVLTSANLSMNAFGTDGLKEAGVLVRSEAVDIDRLWREAEPYEPKPGQIEKLAIDGERERRKGAEGVGPWDDRTYSEWYKLDRQVRTPWKLAWWNDGGEIAKAANILVKDRYGKSGPTDVMNGAKGQFASEDWLLCFHIEGATSASWMFVDHVVEVASNDKKAYEKDYPFQAIQVHPIRAYGRPPFKIDRPFRSAFKKSISEYGYEKIENRHSLAVPQSMINTIADVLRSKVD